MTETREKPRTRRAPDRPLHHVYYGPVFGPPDLLVRRECDGAKLTRAEAADEIRRSGCPNCTVCAVCAEIAGSRGNPHRGPGGRTTDG